MPLPFASSSRLAALLVQRIKRFLSLRLTLYLPTPDERHAKPILSEANTIGQRLKYYRLQKCLTQEDLASRIGTPKACIIKLEVVEHKTGRLIFEYNRFKEADKEAFKEYEDLLTEIISRK